MIDIPETAQCKQCRYLLRGLPTPVCPECGGRFDPLDPGSYRDPGRKRDWRRAWREYWIREFRKPPGVTYLTLLWSLALCLAWRVASVCGTLEARYGLEWEIAVFALTVDTLRFAACALACRALRAEEARAIVQKRRRRWRWALAGWLFLAFTYAYPWPLAMRFFLSKGALETAAADAERQGTTINFRQIGLFNVEYVFPRWPTGGLFIQVGHNRYDSRCGFVREIGRTARESGVWIAPGWYVAWFPGEWGNPLYWRWSTSYP